MIERAAVVGVLIAASLNASRVEQQGTDQRGHEAPRLAIDSAAAVISLPINLEKAI